MDAVFFHGGKWYDEQPMLIGPMNHAFWMSSVVFDGARGMRDMHDAMLAVAHQVEKGALEVAHAHSHVLWHVLCYSAAP